MVIRKICLALLCYLLFSPQINAQVSESCECTIDTVGLSAYISTLTLNENQPLSFEVQNASSTFAILHGYIDSSTPTVVNNFIANYPNVTTLVFTQMPGSDDDDANLTASQALHDAGYKHYLPAVNAYAQDAFIASGAVDMFVGGTVRVVDENAEVGVHSWSDGTNDATHYPEGHAFHLPYINYYVSMGFSQQEAEDFYYFTIYAAPANGIHLMTDSEIDQYKIRSCKYANEPTYSVSQNNNELTADLAGASYQWINCSDNMPIDGATERTFSFTEDGSYAVIVTENSCSDTSACMTVTVAEVNAIETHNYTTNIYPNPTKGKLTLKSTKTIRQIELLEMSGKSIRKLKSKKKKLDISFLPSGIYLLRVTYDDITETVRIIKE